MSEVAALTQELDTMTAAGAILDALDKYYSESCTFTEMAGGASRENRQAQHDHLSGFFSTLEGFNGAALHGSAVRGDLSYSEWTFDMTAGDGSPIVWNEVLVRRWKDGKVVEEKFYNAA